MQALIDPEFALVRAIESVLHRDSRDLTGHEDGTENPKDEAVIDTAVLQGKGIGIDGSSFTAVQQWRHDFPKFDAMSNAPRRRISSSGPSWCADRCPGPRVAGAETGLVFLAFGKSFDACESQLRRTTGHDDGISDVLFRFTRPLTVGYYWCPPMSDNGVDLTALG